MSAAEDYKMGRVGQGDPSKSVTKSSRVNAIQQLVRSNTHGEQYSRSNVGRAMGPGWVVNKTARKPITTATAAESSFPFQIVTQLNADTGVNQIGVIFDSNLFNSEDLDNYAEDNADWGLLDPDQTTGWLDITDADIGKKLFLEIELNENDQSIIGAILAFDFVGGESWTNFPDPIEIDTERDPPAQEFYHQIIGEITNGDIDPRDGAFTLQINGSNVQVNQLLFDDIFLTTAHTTDDANEPDIPLVVNSSPYEPATDTGGSGSPIPGQSDLMTPWSFGPTNETKGDYDFEFFDASSQEEGAQLLILDGVVIGPNDDPVDPQDMPSNDTFTIPVNDGDEVWMEVQWDLEGDDAVSGDNIVSCSISAGANTPDDSGLIQYITMGSVTVDTGGPVPIISTKNEICGDIEIPYPPFIFDDPNEEIFQLSVDKDTGNVVWKTSKIAQVTLEDTGSSGATFPPITLDSIDVLTFDASDFNLYDGGGGQAIVKTSLDVTGDAPDTDFVNGVNKITFAAADDPSQGSITVTDDGGGACTVLIPILPTTGTGTQVLGSDGGDVQWFSTDECST